MSGILLFFLLALSGAIAQDATKVATGPKQQPVAANDESYVIGPEDVLNVNVWKETEMSGSVPVRPDGKISLPLLNDVQAAGLTPMQLSNQLTEKLKQYITDPHVTVTVTSINSKRVYVLGEVGHPGAVTMLPDMTVLQALTTAGGPTPYAKTSKIYVLRTENGTQNKLLFNYKQVIKGQDTKGNLTLKSGDTVVVP